MGGGTVSVRAGRGYLMIEEGALIDVSGTQSILDLPVQQGGQQLFAPRLVVSDAGSVSLRAQEGAVLSGRMLAHGGAGGNAANGTFSLWLDDGFTSTAFPEGPRAITISAQRKATYWTVTEMGHAAEPKERKWEML